MISRPSIDVVQLTPRRGFDVAKCFETSSQLNLLCSDFVLRRDSIARWIFPKRVSSDRYVFSPDTGKVASDYVTGLRFRFDLKRLPSEQKYRAQIPAANRLARFYLSQRERLPNSADAVYCLDCAAEQVFAASTGQLKILEQCIAPRESQFRALESYSSPDVVDRWGSHFEQMGEIEAAEWELADLILCPSEFVRSELVRLGVPDLKIALLPYWTPFQPLREVPKRCADVVRVLFVGNDAARKGLEDFYAVAESLSNHSKMRFQVAGAVDAACSDMRRRYPHGRVEYLGCLAHAELREVLSESHIFFLPTYLEGSSVATYEAMALGLPVVTTPEAGSVVEHERSGYICAAGDRTGFIEAIRKLATDQEMRLSFSNAALERIRNFGFNEYNQSLHSLVGRISAKRKTEQDGHGGENRERGQ